MDIIVHKNRKYGLVNQLMMRESVRRSESLRYQISNITTSQNGIVEKKTITTRCTITVQVIRLIKAQQVHTSSTPILLIRVNRNSAKRSADPLLILFQSRQTRCPYLQYGNSSLVLPIYHGRSQRQMGNYIQEVVRLVKCTN